MAKERRFLTSGAAAKKLGVKTSTLYAYVSRGLLRSAPGSDSRSRVYDREDVEALARRRRQRRDPSLVSEGALDWGLPVLESAITLISTDGRLYYRGEDVARLARHCRVEEVAALVWTGEAAAADELFSYEPRRLPATWRRAMDNVRDAHPGDALQILLRLAAASDLSALEVGRRARVAECGARMLGLMAVSLGGGRQARRSSVLAPLYQAWGLRTRVERQLLDAALVLCADHELNVSSFTARCVASAGSSLYEVVTAGMAALRGFRHGGHSDRVEALLHELNVRTGERPKERQAIRSALARRVRRGDRLPGFGQPLYPDGDPRHRILFELLEEAFPGSPVLDGARHVIEATRELVDDHPTIDFGLATLSAQLGLAPGGAWTVFALGRTIGWIGHAIEEYERRRLIRPRARYTGPRPAAASV